MRVQPLPLLAAAFAAGIAVSGGWLLPPGPPTAAAAAGVVAVLAAARAAPRLALPSLLALALAAGAFWDAQERAAHPDLLRPWMGKRVEVIGRVLDEPAERSFGRVYRLRVAEARRLDAAVPINALVLLRTSPAVSLPPGSLVYAAGVLRPIPSAGNFGEFDYARYAAREHLYASLHARDPFVHTVGPSDLRWDRRVALGLRERLAGVHRSVLPPEYAALLNGIVFGSRTTPVSDEVERDFRNAGAVHILVASGAQIAILVGTLLPALRWLAAPRWLALAVTLAGAWLYALMAGGAPTIVRAGITSAALTAAQLLGRPTDPLSLLALAALVILGLSPGALFDIGFQLSFAAVWGLVALAPWLRHAFPGRPRWLWDLLAASLAAQLATAPVIAYLFCQVAPIGAVANLLAVPMAALLLPAGLGVSALGLLWPAAASWLDGANLSLVWLLRQAMAVCARVPGGHLWVVPPGRLGVTLAYAVLAVLPHVRRSHLAALASSRQARWACLGMLAFLAGWRMPRAGPFLRVTFLDVGQGDSILVQSSSGAALLMDGGGVAGAPYDFGERVLMPALLHRGVRRLDAVVVSHPQADHVGGLAAVCRSLPVRTLIEPDLPAASGDLRRLLECAGRRGIIHLRARAGATWMLDAKTRVTLLHPPELRLAGTVDDTNTNGTVVRVEYGRASFLLTGDIGEEAEAHLCRSPMPLRATVLKVAHHGSRTSSGQAFLEAVSPQVAVVSAGEGNLFGHPAPEVLGRLAATGARLFRTDQDGAVEVLTDGETLLIRTGRSPKAPPWRVPVASD